MNNNSTIAIPADPNNAADSDVSVSGTERGLIGRRLRLLRTGTGLSIAAFAECYGIPAEESAGYENVRLAPPPAVLAYLHVIAAEPEAAARALQHAA